MGSLTGKNKHQQSANKNSQKEFTILEYIKDQNSKLSKPEINRRQTKNKKINMHRMQDVLENYRSLNFRMSNARNFKSRNMHKIINKYRRT